MSDFGLLSLETRGAVAVLTIRRPEVLNAFNTPLILETRRALQMVNDDPSIRALVLTGEGRGFSSGADLAGGGHEGDPTNLTAGEGAAHGMEHRWNPMMDDFHTLSVPTVTAINGVAAGGGVGLALLADVCIAAESARFVLTFGPKLGIVPDLGSTWQLPRRLPRGKALPLALLGDPLSAQEAERLGMIWSVVPDADVVDEAVAVAERLAAASQPAMTEIRHIMDLSFQNSHSEQLELERQAQKRLFDHEENPAKRGEDEHSRKFREAAARRSKSKL